MPIKKDLSDLPSASSAGVPPARNPVITTRLAEAWYARYKANGEDVLLPAIPELPYRASWTGLRCDRALWAAMNKVEETNPPGLTESYRFNIGSLVHGDMQSVFAEFGENWKSEVDVDLRTIGIPGSAHADLIRYDADGKPNLVCEIKTINGFGFKRHATGFKGEPEGPRTGHVLQGALVAAALGAPKVAVIYLSMELLSPDLAKRYVDNEVGRFSAEWHYMTDDLMPLVDNEVARIRRIISLGDQVAVPAIDDPEYPAGAVVVDPTHKRWELQDDGVIIATGTLWFCDYCNYRDWCNGTPITTTNVEVNL